MKLYKDFKQINNSLNLLLALSVMVMSIFLASCGNAHANSVNNSLPCDNSLQIITSSDRISSVESYATQLNCPTPAINICTAFDIDNTLITNEPNFGSEAWGNWQIYLSKAESNNPYLVTNWLSDTNVFDAQSGVRYLINFEQVESTTATTIADLQSKYPTIAITSRGFSSMTTTVRQLLSNNIDMSVNSIGDHQFDNSFLQQNRYKDDLMMYYNGIYYVAGSSKGEALLNMIKYYRNKMGQPNLCQVLIMLDDTPSKIDDIAKALNGSVGLIGINYTRVPQATDPANWYPSLWERQSVELKNTIYNLNHM